MVGFLRDTTPFLGTGKKNRQGQDLETFLQTYDENKYRRPSNTVDTLVIACHGEPGSERAVYKLLMIVRGNHPCIGFWALPGGFVEMEESLEQAAKRELEEETGLRNLPVEQLYTWGDPGRDPRTRVITTAYAAVVREEELPVRAGDDAADADWFEVTIDKRAVREQGQIVEEEYELTLRCTARNLELKSLVVRQYHTDTFLKQECYRVEQAGQIAADHAAVIVQAFHQLRKKG